MAEDAAKGTHVDPFNLGWTEDLGRPEHVKATKMDAQRIEMIRILHKATFPVRYQDKFYDGLYRQADRWSFLAEYQGMLVGAVCCRLEAQNDNRVYIMTLGVLEPYRRIGIAKFLLRKAMKNACETPEVKSMALHVQTTNQLALEFYKQMGFVVHSTIENYYSTLKDNKAYLLVKDMKP
eukprot:TRINITY_DN477_c4_g1_i1.p1 TRINITY_DN477_c4_g1~~TRINITY_DN477_c4_g1_i1.p1  ORF type:complete len:197 (+),score=28.57 TRINITY_DN477_c4_g1_i1:56-592(+)